jgi:hypothetical protein
MTDLSRLLPFLVAACAACGGGTPTYTIAGQVSGVASSGVTVNLTGAATASTITDTNGAFAFINLAPGSYVVTPVLEGDLFNPAAMSFVLNGSESLAANFAASRDPSIVRITGIIEGAVLAGVTVTLTGEGLTRTATSDASGLYGFGLVPDGTYTITPSAPSWSFAPAVTTVTTNHNDAGADFLSMPPSSPVAVHVAGDAASGVPGGTFLSEHKTAFPNPDVVVYDPVNDVWTFTLRFDGDVSIGLGSNLVVHGTPAAALYTGASPALFEPFGGPCWFVAPPTPPGQEIIVASWEVSSFALSFDTVGPPVATNMPGQGNTTEVFYSVHGSFHADCPAVPGSGAQGVVTLDATF